MPVHGTRTHERQVAQSLSRERMVASMTATFGSVATLLAVVGLYGVIREVLQIGAIGFAIGVPVAWWLGRHVSAQLYGVRPRDPIALAGAVLFLLAAPRGWAHTVASGRTARPDEALCQE